MHRGQPTVRRRRGMGHALVVDPGCWLGSKEREAEHGFPADTPPHAAYHPCLRSLLVGKTLTVSRTTTTDAEDGVRKAG